MAAPRPATPGAKRDKGTRGGRPEPQASQARGSQARVRRAGPGARPGAAGQASATATATATQPATRPAPLWLQLTTWTLSLGGLGVSTYLTYAHYTTASNLACSDKG